MLKAKQKTKLLKMYQRIWTSKVVSVSGHPKALLSLFYLQETAITYEPYLSLIRHRKHKVNYTKLRLSDHPLMIEAGRHLKFKIQQEERI